MAKTLIMYFSCTGETKKVAEKLNEFLGGDIMEIVPEQLYLGNDLNWNDTKSRCSIESRDRSSRPAIKTELPDFSQYDTVFVGFPIWWNLPPTIIYTLLDRANLSNQKVILFATSGSSSIENAKQNLIESYPKLDFSSAKLLSSMSSDDDIRKWLTII